MPNKSQTSEKKEKKRAAVLIPLIALVLIAGLALYNYLGNQVALSNSPLPGNTAGNLYNDGLFCENGGRIFFSNPNDDYTLYSMSDDLTDFKKLYNDYARYINADENYVYYTRKNNKKENGSPSIFIFYSTGVYRLKRNGSGLSVITQEPTGSLLLYKNRLYYQIYNKNALELHRVGIDKSDDSVVSKGDAAVVSVFDDRLLFSGHPDNQNLYTLGTGDSSPRLYRECNAYTPIAVEDGIYYINTADSYRLYFCDYENTRNECVINHEISWYNITGDGRYIFYQQDKKTAGIYMYDTETGTSTLISEGNYKNINIAGGYCFFYEYGKDTAYAYNYSTGVLNFFNPPVLK